MSFTSERLQKAFEVLRTQGHTVNTTPAMVSGSELHVRVDDRFCSMTDIYDMAALPDDVYAFTDRNGKECQVGIFFEYRVGPSYAFIQDGQRVGGRQPIPSDTDVPGFVLSMSREMGATSLRRLQETVA